ncbi:hypothetical protein RIF29_34630 [Crotalaria pallida]|uniref:Uncharacterized protein n=1 Tax=Crotalaria pallida TaxID=3830 RepID=A0AAN9HRB7_CROPI
MRLARCLTAKYKVQDVLQISLGSYSNKSSLWRGIVSACPKVYEGLLWIMGNGCKIKFWRDNWIPGIGKLVDTPGITPPAWCDNYPAVHYSINRSWDWELLYTLLPIDICSKIVAVNPPHYEARPDCFAWKGDGSENYLQVSCYNAYPR